MNKNTKITRIFIFSMLLFISSVLMVQILGPSHNNSHHDITSKIDFLSEKKCITQQKRSNKVFKIYFIVKIILFGLLSMKDKYIMNAKRP
jgi:hypothetical protein